MNARVLIVDDSFTVRMDLKEALEAVNREVSTCATIAEAREKLATERFGLIILDVRLPDGDGIDLLAEIRNAEDAAQPAVMLLSSEAEVADRIRGLRTGADEYVGKPYDLNHVVARADELLRPQAGSAAADRTILVIDDSTTYREQLRQALQDAGYGVLTASSGEEGLRLAASARPTAMIVDGVLPGIDGGSVIRRVRMDAALRYMPCILLTASKEFGAEIRALDAGADAFVRKGEEIEVLLARLAAVLRGVEGQGPAGRASRSLVGPKKILLVDDSETFLQEVSGALRDDGYDVVLARSGEEALELLTAQHVDSVLLDLRMPGIGGFETCQRIKATPLVRGIPVIMLTSMDERQAMIRGLDAGADDYVTKSSDFQVLRSRIQAQIRRKQFEDENRMIREELARRELETIEARAAREVEEIQAVLAERERSEAAMNQLQSELAHVSRWNVMGMMAATLAHELTQPLTAAINFLNALQQLHAQSPNPEADDMAGEMISNAIQQMVRAGAIIKNLRHFIEKRETGRAREDLNQVVEEAIALGAVRSAADTIVEVTLDPRLPEMVIDKVQIQQVLVNLCRNAVEAMRSCEHRVLRIETRYDEAGFVCVSVSDTGSGIDPDVMSRLFQPFTTTKQDGMGIGLKICQSIIEAHHGTIEVAPNEERGVTFQLRLPVGDPSPPA